MAYSYYRHAPGWGTQQFQFGAPPMPSYQPLPSWTGQDFYSAHALGGDPMLYQNTISRFSSGMTGVGKHDAKLLHYRAYGGLGEITHMMPQEIGAAAAYEAYREIKYGRSVYQFLYGDYDRHRDALRATAIAEVVRLWQETGRGLDQYGLQVACDSAAATAYHIVSQSELEEGMGMGMGMGMGFGAGRSRRNSFAAFPTSGYAGSGYGGGGSVYGGGGSVYGGGGSVYGGGGSMYGGSPLMPSSPIALPGSPYSPMGGVPYVGSMGSMGGYASPYVGSYGGGGYVGSYPPYGSPGLAGYDLGYPQAMSAMSMGGYAGSGSTAVILPPSSEGRRHRHRSHSHRHHRRHRSHDRY